MNSQPFRVQPQLPAHAMKTYSVSRPGKTHWREARCEEVDCWALNAGWQTVVDESTSLGAQQAHYIRKESKRKFREQRGGTTADGTAIPPSLTVFWFEPGQQCFTQHQVEVGRPPLYLVRDGDWRGNPRRTHPQIHARPDDWVDDFATNQQRLADLHNRG